MSHIVIQYTANAANAISSAIQTAMSPLNVPLQMDYLSLIGTFPSNDAITTSGQQVIRTLTLLFPTTATATAVMGAPSSSVISAYGLGIGAGVISPNPQNIYPPFPQVGQAVASVTAVTPGAKYACQPYITVSGGGIASGNGGCILEAVMQVDTVTPLIVMLPGSGYTTPTVAFVGGLGPGGVAATGTVSVGGGGAISAVTVTSGGSGYVGMPNVVITDSAGSSGSGAVVYAGLSLKKILVVQGGMGFTSAPTVTITDANSSLYPGSNDLSPYEYMLKQPLEAAIVGPVSFTAGHF